MAEPEFQLRVQAAVESESVDGDFFPPVGVCEFQCQADGRLKGSVVESGGRGSPFHLPLPQEDVAVDGTSLTILQCR